MIEKSFVELVRSVFPEKEYPEICSLVITPNNSISPYQSIWTLKNSPCEGEVVITTKHNMINWRDIIKALNIEYKQIYHFTKITYSTHHAIIDKREKPILNLAFELDAPVDYWYTFLGENKYEN